MEYKRHVPAKKSTAKAKGGVRTAIVIVISLALAAAIIVLSPAGDFLLSVLELGRWNVLRMRITRSFPP